MTGATTTGRRTDPPFAENGALIGDWPQPGDYYRAHGVWYACAPDGRLASLAKHDVVEHEDGTVTVSPSILVGGGGVDAPAWHGYLERGVWREC